VAQGFAGSNTTLFVVVGAFTAVHCWVTHPVPQQYAYAIWLQLQVVCSTRMRIRNVLTHL
jgi:hypothetical protein